AILSPIQQTAQEFISFLFLVASSFCSKGIACITRPSAWKVFAYHTVIARTLHQYLGAVVNLRYAARGKKERHSLPEPGHVATHAMKDSIHVVVIRKYLVCLRVFIEKVVAQCFIQCPHISTRAKCIQHREVQRIVGHSLCMRVVPLVVGP